MTKTLGKLPVESVSVGLALVHLRRFVVRRMIGQKRTGPDVTECAGGAEPGVWLSTNDEPFTSAVKR